jgi:hypothetical protein
MDASNNLGGRGADHPTRSLVFLTQHQLKGVNHGNA